MKSTTLLLTLAALSISTLACRCNSWSTPTYYDYDITKECCAKMGAEFRYDGTDKYDCNAHTMSEKLSNFHSCCFSRDNALKSDCRW